MRHLVRPGAAGVDRFDAKALGRVGQQGLQNAAHDALDTGAQVLLHHGRDIDQQLLGQADGLVVGDGAGAVGQIAGRGRSQLGQAVQQALVVVLGAGGADRFDAVAVVSAHWQRAVLDRQVGRAGGRQAGAHGGAGAQGGQGGG